MTSAPQQDARPHHGQALIDAILPAVLEAGRAIMDVRAGHFTVQHKDDRSPVTLADERAERILLATVDPLLADVPVIAEERATKDGVPVDAGPRFWLVDPLDGTKEFINGRTDFTVNVALIENRLPRLGVVYAPATGRLFAGIAGEGAWQALVTGEKINFRQSIHVRRANPNALDVVASKSHRDAETNAFLETLPLGDLKAAGSSLKFCLLAAGEADLYPRFGPTMEWDTAAGHAVLAGAGGRVSTPEGQPFLYAKPGFRNGPFIAAGDPGLPF